MNKKLFVFSGVLLIAVTMAAIYLIGLYHGRTGEGLSFTKEAVAAQTKPRVSPVKAL